MRSLNELSDLAGRDRIVWRNHASRRMIERGIKRKDVKTALMVHEIIEEYPDAFPYPSYLLLGFSEN